MASQEPQAVSAFESCTRCIGIVKPSSSDMKIVLVDTPGFTHDYMTDAEVLNVIADWLKTTCVFFLYEDSSYSTATFQL